MPVKNNRQAAVTLIELTIALAVFSVVMLVAIESFMSVLRVSRESVYKQSLQDHAGFLFEMMSRELRTAKANYNDSGCGDFVENQGSKCRNAANNYYCVYQDNDTQALLFINAEGQCVRYFTAIDNENNALRRLKVERCLPQQGSNCAHTNSSRPLRSAWVTPINLTVADLYFETTDLIKYQDGVPSRQAPSVAYHLKLQSMMWNPPTLDYYNFVTARAIEQF